jgi:internalin A
MRDQVFISYSHDDEKFLNELLIHLKPLQRAGRVAAWSDRQIAPGSQWFAEIQTALARTKVAVMLVTPNFLASDFIHEHELGPLLKEAEQGGVKILWVPVRACSYEETLLKDYHAVLSPDKPLAEMKAERDSAWVKVCGAIKNALNP